MPADLLIKNGTIIDGLGGEPVAGDVAVSDGHIFDIGALAGTDAFADVPSLDATGLYVTPGFIDIHSHSDLTLLVDPRAVSSIMQGVTMEVVGNCGHGCAPIGDAQLARSIMYGSHAPYDINWRTMGGYLDHLEATRPAVNVVTLVPNGQIRLTVVPDTQRPATPSQLKQMKKLLAESLDDGAFGLSTGLEYGPETACPEDEITQMCRVVADKGGFYATHTRNRHGQAHETIDEAIRTGQAAGLGVQISHIQVVARLGDDGKAAMRHAIEQVEQATRQGRDVSFDMHTRLFGTTRLSTALPPWALEGDAAAVAKRLRDPAARVKFKQYKDLLSALVRGDYSLLVLFQSKAKPQLKGKTFAEISEQMGVEPKDAIYNLLLDEVDDIHNLMIIALTYKEDEHHIGFCHHDCMIGSDATAMGPDGPLADSTFHGAYTWASWYFKHFVRETKTMSAAEAVRRLTSLPAGRLGLSDRGVIRKGAWADLAVFDPHAFAERGTMFEPNQTAAGMVHVLVNGRIAVRDGQPTAERPGRVIRSR